MRFDDSLETVLAADMSSTFGAQSAWRQLVDLIGRRRVPASPAAIARLRAIRPMVAPPVRAASARAIAQADPPAALVRLFADDEISIAAPVLRMASIESHEWVAMLPGMSPATRSVLRHRRDLAPDVLRALESFGSVDFVLSSSVPPVAVEVPLRVADDMAELASLAADEGEAVSEPLAIDWTEVIAPIAVAPVTAAPVEPVAEPAVAHVPWRIFTDHARAAEAVVAPAAVESATEQALAEEPAPPPLAEQAVPDAPTEAPDLPDDVAILSPPATSFVSFSSVALGLPVVAEALRQSGEGATTEPVDTTAREPEPEPEPEQVMEMPAEPVPAETVEPPAPVVAQIVPPLPPPEAAAGTFQIAELVARIDAYQRQREEAPALPLPSTGPEMQPELFVLDHAPAESFRFETDAVGVVRWIEGAARAPLIGLSLDLAALPSGSRVDGVAAGAFRRRAGFTNARLVVEGQSDAAGQWRITGLPVFDRASGRFTGYRGSARRPRADEMAEPAREGRNPASDALRQLVHELRTPANAIAGFAEMIESQLLGPVPQPYRVHAATIRNQTHDLLGAIDDIDMAARIESDALDLRPGDVPVAPMLARIADDLAPLAHLRRAELAIDAGADGIAIAGDDRAVERLIARLMATLVSSGSPDERIAVVARGEGDRTVALAFDRPRALGAYAEERLLTIDAEVEAEREGAPLLGTGFALRLARNLATELGGSLTIGEDNLTLRLPAAFLPHVEQVSSS
uniref:sensor histidine kinase n=1 Tax=Sphingomonas bacterium TaxID=1895847 RepID=UPI00260E11BC|nr:HAMP domain-containing sensor histidine kinase [Sphingomonas bacterium]